MSLYPDQPSLSATGANHVRTESDERGKKTSKKIWEKSIQAGRVYRS